jgi:hypothetical protein
VHQRQQLLVARREQLLLEPELDAGHGER